MAYRLPDKKVLEENRSADAAIEAAIEDARKLRESTSKRRWGKLALVVLVALVMIAVLTLAGVSLTAVLMISGIATAIGVALWFTTRIPRRGGGGGGSIPGIGGALR